VRAALSADGGFPIAESPSKIPINVGQSPAGMGPSSPVHIGSWMENLSVPTIIVALDKNPDPTPDLDGIECPHFSGGWTDIDGAFG